MLPLWSNIRYGYKFIIVTEGSGVIMRLLLLLWGTSFITQILITTSNNASTEDATITKNNIWIERSYFTQGDSTANLWSNDYNIFNYDAVHLNKYEVSIP